MFDPVNPKLLCPHSAKAATFLNCGNKPEDLILLTKTSKKGGEMEERKKSDRHTMCVPFIVQYKLTVVAAWFRDLPASCGTDGVPDLNQKKGPAK